MDGCAIQFCSDDQLNKFGLNAFGDILALRNFVRQKEANSDNSLETRKKALADAVKMSRPISTSKGVSNVRNKSITLGWKNYNKKTHKYASVRRCGGSRTISVDKHITIKDIKQMAVAMFFPNNMSKLGNIAFFKYDLGSF